MLISQDGKFKIKLFDYSELPSYTDVQNRVFQIYEVGEAEPVLLGPRHNNCFKKGAETF